PPSPAIPGEAGAPQPAAAGGEITEAIAPPAQRAAIAVEIEHHRLVPARRHMPDDHALAVGGVEDDLFRLRQARRGGRRGEGPGEILPRALADIEQRAEGAIPQARGDHETLQGVHAPVVARRLYKHLSKLTVAPRDPHQSEKRDEFFAGRGRGLRVTRRREERVRSVPAVTAARRPPAA